MHEKFKLYLKLEKGLSDNTVEAYLNDIADFLTWQSQTLSLSLNQLSKDHILDFCENCKKRGLNESTISRRLVTLKIYFRFLHQQGTIPKDISENLESPRLARLLPDYLSLVEIEKLLNVYDEEKVLDFWVKNAIFKFLIYPRY